MNDLQIDMKETLQLMNPECDFDIHYNFYYDETNNIRRYHNEGGSLNYTGDSNFILGGIAFTNDPPIEELFTSLSLQNNISEVKFKHIASGLFLDVLKSRKLTAILDFLNTKDVYLHFHSVNLLYFAVVDIIDSAISSSDLQYSLQEINELKSILHDALSLRIDKTVEFFHHFNYPNVKKEEFTKFTYHIKKNIRHYRKIYKAGISEIEMLLDAASHKRDMPFITDETPNVFIESFFPFYHFPTSVFSNSVHYFDKEDHVMDIFGELKNSGTDFINDNYYFIESNESKYIQLSDICVGILGKLYEYINTSNFDSIIRDIKIINDQQRNNYKLLKGVINKSITKNPAFMNNTMSISQHQILNLILDK